MISNQQDLQQSTTDLQMQKPTNNMMYKPKPVEVQSSDDTIVYKPKPVDVLCGRGKMCFHHDGNDRFRMLIAEHADTYKQAPTKKAKMQVVMLIVDIVIARGGRFLIRTKEGSWVDGGRKQGKKKTGHAFRDALRGRVKCITQMRESNAFINARSDDSDASFYSESSSDVDLDNSDYLNPLATFPPNYIPHPVEPSDDWTNVKVDKDVASDLLNFFIAEQLEETVARDVARMSTGSRSA